MIVVDALYSTNGSVAPLGAVVEIAERNVVRLAGWRLVRVDAAAFLGATSLDAKLRLLVNCGLPRL